MKKYMVVKTETLEKILNCFTEKDELDQFMLELHILIDEINFSNMLIIRSVEDSEEGTVLLLKQLFLLSVFFKKNIEVLKSIMQVVEYREVTEEKK